MKKQFFLLFSLIGSLSGLFAQKGSWGEFPMIPAKSFAAKAEAAGKIKGTPAYQKALKVYERLVEARGDFRYPVPNFYMTNKQTVAEIVYAGPDIFLSEKAFAVCESFGDQSEAAIAFLLGHELTHYYEKHAWRKNFASDHSDLTISKQLDELFAQMLADSTSQNLRPKLLRFDTLVQQMELIAMEVQSDYLGGFLAYSAGFGSFRQGDELIRRLYKEFNISEVSEGYVTRREREEMSLNSAKKMDELVEIFEMANLLTVVGQYEEAYRFYGKVLVEYQSREIYNNVGVTALLQALKYFKEEELKYRYPIQLDLDMANSRGPEEDSIRNRLLKQSILHFDAAISLDPGYAPAYLNKSCALALLGDPVRAYFYADVEARKVSTGKYAAQIQQVELILGILEAQSKTPEEQEKAKARFSALLTTDKSGLAAYNFAKLNQKTPPTAPKLPIGIEDESIDGKSAFNDRYPEEDWKIWIDDALTFHQNTQYSAHSKLFFSRRYGKNSGLFQITTPNYAGQTSRDIRLGASLNDIEQKYGAAPRSIQTPNGQILCYEQDHILFVLKQGKLQSWVLYNIL